MFFIDLDGRRVHFAGLTANPGRARTTQQARNLVVGITVGAAVAPRRVLTVEWEGEFAISRAVDRRPGRRHRLRQLSNADLRRQYIHDTRPLLEDLGIEVPSNRLNRRFL